MPPFRRGHFLSKIKIRPVVQRDGFLFFYSERATPLRPVGYGGAGLDKFKKRTAYTFLF